jgi:hypothetical protein
MAKRHRTARQDREQKILYNKKYRFTRNLGERYTQHETGMILMHTIPDVELAKEIGRPVVQIRIQRSRLRKKMQDGILKLV